MEKKIIQQLTSDEKIYWYHYLAWMEYVNESEHFEQKTEWPEKMILRTQKVDEARDFAKMMYSTVKSQLLDELTVEELSRLSPAPTQRDYEPYNFMYLERDWSNEQQALDQRGTIINHIEDQLHLVEDFSYENGQAFFAGCGNGRYAVEFAKYYDKVYANDKSLMMLWTTEYLSEKKTWDISYDIVRNCRLVDDSKNTISLEISDELRQRIHDKVEFKVGDFSKLNFNNGSIKHFYSIYFTDVLPLDMLWSQVDSLLQTNGLFIHFGPLEYFFTDEKQLLTVEEVKDYFIERNYEILVDNFLKTRYLGSDKVMRYRVYDNWCFIARKKAREPLTLASVVHLKNNVTLLNTNSYSTKEASSEWLIKSLNQVYQLPDIVGETILKCDGVKTLEDILNEDVGYSLTESESEVFMGIIEELTYKFSFLNKN